MVTLPNIDTNILETKSFKLAVKHKGDVAAKKIALVLPGRLDTKDYIHIVSHLELLASKGFLAVSFDPPGTWESPGDPRDYTMTNYIKATNELIEYFGNKPTLIVGISRGGTVGMLVGTQNAYVTGFVAVMSWPASTIDVQDNFPNPEWEKAKFKISKRDLPPGNKEGLPQIEHKFFYEFAKDAIQYDARPFIKLSQKPKLFIAGITDETVSKQVVQEAFEMSAKPKMYKEVDSGHNYRYDKKVIQAINVYIGAFIESNSL